METLVTLEPLCDPNEVLFSGLHQRQQLELRGNAHSPQTLVLGRGSFTGIRDESIGSSVLEISLQSCDGVMVLRATRARDAAMSRVQINGRPFASGLKTILLNSGDMISLDGLRYEYRVHITELSGSASAPGSDPLGGDLGLNDEDFWDANSHIVSSPGTKSDDAGVYVSKTECSQLSDEIHCSVCLEIQVNSRSIHPCGHSVCAICIKKLTECPQCRKKINSHIPNMQLDGLIDKLVSIPSLLDAEDIKGYHERKKTAKMFPAVDLTPMSGTKRRRSGSSRHNGYRGPREQLLNHARGLNLDGSQRTPRIPSALSMGFAFGDVDDEFYMPPHLGPQAAAAATARAVSHAVAATARMERPGSHIRRHVQSASRSYARAPRMEAIQAALQLPPQPPSEGSSLENAISID